MRAFMPPGNLLYNTTAPGIVLFLNRPKPKTRQGKVFLVNASQVLEKGDPKNLILDDGIQRIADTLIECKEEEKLSRIVYHAELKKNDYNTSASRYIHTSDAEIYRPIVEIVEELNGVEVEARETDNEIANNNRVFLYNASKRSIPATSHKRLAIAINFGSGL